MAEQAVSEKKTYTKEKKKLDPRIAFAIMVVMICCALLLGANKAWTKKHQAVEISYSVLADNLTQRVETAYNLLTVACRYLPADHEQIAALRQDIQQMQAAGLTDRALSEALQGGQRFSADAAALLSTLAANSSVQADSRDSMYVSLMLPQAVEQCSNSAPISAYQETADSFNQGMRSFSGLLARLTGVQLAPDAVSYGSTAVEVVEGV